MARVIWTEPALNDLDEIADYIAVDKPLAARLLVQKIFKKAELLRKFPQLGTIPPELKEFPYRQLVIPPCRIFYRIDKKTVYMVAVIRGERTLRRDLLDRP